MAQASQLADAGGADQGQIVVGVDPFALNELLEQGAIETSGGAIVDVGSQTFHSVHVEAATRVARLAREAGVGRFIHVSGIGADAEICAK